MVKRRRRPKSLPIGGKRLGVEYFKPEDISTQYTDGCVVRHTDEAFFLSFVQLELPVSPNAGDHESLTKLRSVCISQLVMTPSTMMKIAKALKVNVERYEKKYGEIEGADDTDDLEEQVLEVGVSETEERVPSVSESADGIDE